MEPNEIERGLPTRERMTADFTMDLRWSAAAREDARVRFHLTSMGSTPIEIAVFFHVFIWSNLL
jgi:hypothetical protein